MAEQNVSVTDNPDQSRYDVTVDGQLAGYLDYRTRDDVVVFVHAEIYPRHEGQGIGSRLAKFALDDVISAGRSFVPQCPFIAHYVDKHEEYSAHVAG